MLNEMNSPQANRSLKGKQLKSVKIICITTFVFILTSISGFSQWLPEARLTTNPNPVSCNSRCIAARGNYLHVVWTDTRHPDNEIYYKRSTNNGVTWEPDYRFTTQTGQSINPQISVFNSNVHVVWQDDRDGNTEIYYNRSNDDGVTFGNSTRLTNDAASSTYPSISVTGILLVYVSWSDSRDGNNEIYFKRSSDGGVNWEPVIRLSNAADVSTNPDIFSSGTNVYVSWADNRYGASEIFFKRSTDFGINWGPETRLTNDPAFSSNPAVTAVNQLVNVFWQDTRNGQQEIYYKRSTDAGISWSTDTRMTTTQGSTNVSSAISGTSGQFLHIAWEKYNSSNSRDIVYRNSTDGGINWSGNSIITPAGGFDQFNPSVSLSGNAVHIVWKDGRNVGYNMYYRQNPSGNPTAITNISSETPSEFSLSQNYPNPFNPNTNIGFRIADFGFVSLKVYDIMGKEAAVLVNENLNA
ncbi:MAG: hypothetical protein ABI543_12375, partial [Ignavibacteria bacterium]